MKPALLASALFLAAIVPGLLNHGTPLPHSDSPKAPPSLNCVSVVCPGVLEVGNADRKVAESGSQTLLTKLRFWRTA